jgi:cobalamin biosynthesis protein CobT
MARQRRTLDRRALRADNEAAERRKADDETDETEDEEESDDEESEEDEDAEASGDEEESEEGGDDDDEDEPKPKPKPKKKAPAKPKVTKARTRTPKVTRMKVVWGVFNNSHQVVEEFDYPRKQDAVDLVAKLTADKKSGHPFFLQPVKKPLDKA